MSHGEIAIPLVRKFRVYSQQTSRSQRYSRAGPTPVIKVRYDLPLATLNLKDYEDFRTHHGLRILGVD
jgi:hypothetical protein